MGGHTEVQDSLEPGGKEDGSNALGPNSPPESSPKLPSNFQSCSSASLAGGQNTNSSSNDEIGGGENTQKGWGGPLPTVRSLLCQGGKVGYRVW